MADIGLIIFISTIRMEGTSFILRQVPIMNSKADIELIGSEQEKRRTEESFEKIKLL
jgi:hypothetical protein